MVAAVSLLAPALFLLAMACIGLVSALIFNPNR